MCFSAAASFTASAVLGVVGIATIARAKNGREVPLAIIPLFFAVQQFIEGLLWVSLRGTQEYALPLTYLFLFFALLWWPIFAPLATYFIEDVPWRKKIIAGFCVLGIVVGVAQYSAFLWHPTTGEVINKCIFYTAWRPFPQLPIVILYGLATVGASLISSKRIINLFGILSAIFAFIAWRIYAANFSSVWCYFAAVLSLILYFYFRSKKTAHNSHN